MAPRKPLIHRTEANKDQLGTLVEYDPSQPKGYITHIVIALRPSRFNRMMPVTSERFKISNRDKWRFMWITTLSDGTPHHRRFDGPTTFAVDLSVEQFIEWCRLAQRAQADADTIQMEINNTRRAAGLPAIYDR